MKDRTPGMQPQDSEELGHMKDAFSINRETKVYLHQHMNSTDERPQKQGLPLMQSECSNGKTIIGNDRSKLGGLHKEYTVLKDIIVSSTKNTLSWYTIILSLISLTSKSTITLLIVGMLLSSTQSPIYIRLLCCVCLSLNYVVLPCRVPLDLLIECFSFGLRTTKGVLLHGPPGTGKTSLARLCVIDAGVNLFSVNGPEIFSQYYGESEQAMHKVFDSACQSAPAVVCLLPANDWTYFILF
ncbi:hypothetical protein NC651_015054 [Populus alba x Populus x berolinensis]|nr:hypothetical protein NC651_015054 [Populus alba x Populus x berolinensis]